MLIAQTDKYTSLVADNFLLISKSRSRSAELFEKIAVAVLNHAKISQSQTYIMLFNRSSLNHKKSRSHNLYSIIIINR